MWYTLSEMYEKIGYAPPSKIYKADHRDRLVMQEQILDYELEGNDIDIFYSALDCTHIWVCILNPDTSLYNEHKHRVIALPVKYVEAFPRVWYNTDIWEPCVFLYGKNNTSTHNTSVYFGISRAYYDENINVFSSREFLREQCASG